MRMSPYMTNIMYMYTCTWYTLCTVCASGKLVILYCLHLIAIGRDIEDNSSVSILKITFLTSSPHCMCYISLAVQVFTLCLIFVWLIRRASNYEPKKRNAYSQVKAGKVMHPVRT